MPKSLLSPFEIRSLYKVIIFSIIYLSFDIELVDTYQYICVAISYKLGVTNILLDFYLLFKTKLI